MVQGLPLPMWSSGLRLRVEGSGSRFRAQGLGFRDQGAHRVWKFIRVQDLELRACQAKKIFGVRALVLKICRTIIATLQRQRRRTSRNSFARGWQTVQSLEYEPSFLRELLFLGAEDLVVSGHQGEICSRRPGSFWLQGEFLKG